MNTPKTEPVAVTILVLSGATMMTLASIIDPMRAANRLSDNQDFNWIAVSPQGEQVELAGGISFPLSNRFEPGSRGKYLIVIASFDHARHASVPLIT